MVTERHNSEWQAWFCTTGLPSDVAIEVDGMSFHLHRFPLMSKSRKLHEMITEQEKNTGRRIESSQQIGDSGGEEKEEIREEENTRNGEGYRIVLPYFPGGSESFETAAKFCYGMSIDLSAANVAALRCAGEYLGMTEEYSEDNLVSKTEIFISQSVLRSIKHSLKTLASCRGLLPMAEDLGIVQRCIEAIANKIAAADPSLFGWPVNDETEANHRRKVKNSTAAVDLWLDELVFVSLPFFKRLIVAMKGLNPSGEIIESCLIHYAKKCIPGVSRTTRKPFAEVLSENEQIELLETVISNLPKERTSRSAANATRFLFGLLRTAYILNASEVYRLTLEKKIGSQLEQATLDDLLIPSYSYLNETLYDVDCVERILRYFLDTMEERSAGDTEGGDESANVRSAAVMLVGKLIDGYLSEIASDANLKPDKFYDLAIALPDRARLFDDGLYRAVDVYLKAHPWIPEADRDKICGILDCRKLTLEACTHAAQNERLPLRAVVQVLFFEQLQLRRAIAGTRMAADAEHLSEDEENAPAARAAEGGGAWRINEELRTDMDSMRTRVQELEKECRNMKKAIQSVGPRGQVAKGGWWSKLGCKFKLQVCDSRGPPSPAEARKAGGHRREQ